MNTLSSAPTLDALIREIDRYHLTPGWIPRAKPLLWPEMQSAFVPAHWRYADARSGMQAAGRLIGTDLAERRNFVMRNPIPDNDTATLRTLICAYQSILPGEQARSHRHASHALRVILEARGAFSVVDGVKHPMESGDIVLTPGGCWHGHGHDGEEQAFWFDGLDVPLTHLLEPMFFEEHPKGFEPVVREDVRSPYRFAWRDTLQAVSNAIVDPWFGGTVHLPAPLMPTIQLTVHGWPAGWRNRAFRHSANTILVVMKGEGRSVIGEHRFNWQFGDTLAVPAWTRIAHESHDDSVMFAMSDEQLMRWSRYYRFEPLDREPR